MNNMTIAYTYPHLWKKHMKLFRRAVPRDVIATWVVDDTSPITGRPRMVYRIPVEYYPAWCETRKQARINWLQDEILQTEMEGEA